MKRKFKPATKAECEELRDKWYKKLENVKDETYPTGFIDIERDEETLKVWSSDKFASRRLVQNGGWQAKATYHSLAERYLAEYPFENRREQIIWEYHTNAVSVRDIVKLLKKVRIKMKRTSVWEIIKKHKSKMFALYMADQTKPGEA
jgi:hypothetical protein